MLVSMSRREFAAIREIIRKQRVDPFLFEYAAFRVVDNWEKRVSSSFSNEWEAVIKDEAAKLRDEAYSEEPTLE